MPTPNNFIAIYFMQVSDKWVVLKVPGSLIAARVREVLLLRVFVFILIFIFLIAPLNTSIPDKRFLIFKQTGARVPAPTEKLISWRRWELCLGK